jgi:hypothetical protein
MIENAIGGLLSFALGLLCARLIQVIIRNNHAEAPKIDKSSVVKPVDTAFSTKNIGSYTN